MREIKFRVWNDRRMVYDSGLSFKGNSIICESQSIPMQFTGLIDKNGKEIYEGDIIQRKYMVDDVNEEHVDRGRVIFEQGAFLIEGCGSYSWHIDTPVDSIKEWEVIGNIYENPELKKGSVEW